jgi:MFS family permease
MSSGPVETPSGEYRGGDGSDEGCFALRSYLRVLRHHDFRLLFLGQSASAVGDQVVFVALALFITRRTGSATDLGIVLASQSLPLIALVLFGGVWADRGGGAGRRRMMIACDLARAALHAALAALIFAGVWRIWEIALLEAGFGAARAFFQPAYTGLLPQTVSEDTIQDARALTESSQNLAALLGPALATALVLGVGAGFAFAFDAATFVVSAALLVAVVPRSRGGEPARESLIHELRLGWREVISRDWVWVTIGVYTGAVMVVYAFWNTLAPLVARQVYGGAGVFGVMASVEGAGAVIAALAGVVWRPAKPMRAGLLLSLCWPLPGLELALSAPLALVLVTCVATGFGFALMLIWWETALARHIPPHALSRVSAYDWMGSLALLPVGQAVAGPLAATFGAREVLGVGAAIGLGLLCLTLIPRSVRELGDAPVLAEQLAREVGVEAGGEA